MKTELYVILLLVCPMVLLLGYCQRFLSVKTELYAILSLLWLVLLFGYCQRLISVTTELFVILSFVSPMILLFGYCQRLISVKTELHVILSLVWLVLIYALRGNTFFFFYYSTIVLPAVSNVLHSTFKWVKSNIMQRVGPYT